MSDGPIRLSLDALGSSVSPSRSAARAARAAPSSTMAWPACHDQDTWPDYGNEDCIVKKHSKSASVDQSIHLFLQAAHTKASERAVTQSAPASSSLLHSALIASVDDSLSSTGHVYSSSLPGHPFADPCARSASSTYLSSSQWASPTESFVSSSPSLAHDGPRPPSSASFINMGKSAKGKRGSGPLTRGLGHRWGRSVSDGIPLMVQQARKSGSRLWRTLTRPSAFSFLDNPRSVATDSPPFIAVEDRSLDVPSERSQLVLAQLLPRPAPYFYPRHVDTRAHGLGQHPGMIIPDRAPSFGERPRACSADIPRSESRLISMLGSNAANLDRHESHGGDGDGASINSNEIWTWKQPKIDTGSEKSNVDEKIRPTLRQRLGSSLSFNQHLFPPLRPVRSEQDLNQFLSDQGDSEQLGPGINDDPFAAFFLSPQFSPPQGPLFAPACSPPSPHSTTASIPSFLSSVSSSNLEKCNPESNRRSLMYVDPGSDNLPISSSCAEAPNQRTSPSTPCHHSRNASINRKKLILPTHSSDLTLRVTQKPAVPPSLDEEFLTPNQTPTLTPDRDSIVAASPPLPGSCWGIGSSSADRHWSSGRERDASGVPFPLFDSPASGESFMESDVFEESAVAEGTSQDVIFHSCAMQSSDISSDYEGSVRSPSLESQHPLLLGGDTDDDAGCILDTSNSNVAPDISIGDTDLVPLTAEWPLPPRRTLFLEPTPGLGWYRVASDLEYFKPGKLNSPGDRLRVQEGRCAPSPGMSILNEDRVAKLSERLGLVDFETSCRPAQCPSSPIGSAEVLLGSSILENASLPNVIVIAANPSGTTLTIRAATRPGLISFCAFHAETGIASSHLAPPDRECEPVDGHVTLCTITKGDTEVEDVAMISLGEDSSSDSASGSVSFPFHLPATFGQLAVAIAKISFARKDGRNNGSLNPLSPPNCSIDAMVDIHDT